MGQQNNATCTFLHAVSYRCLDDIPRRPCQQKIEHPIKAIQHKIMVSNNPMFGQLYWIRVDFFKIAYICVFHGANGYHATASGGPAGGAM
jgi:hypothetical protein